jgi:hypothetical protein
MMLIGTYNQFKEWYGVKKECLVAYKLRPRGEQKLHEGCRELMFLERGEVLKEFYYESLQYGSVLMVLGM